MTSESFAWPFVNRCTCLVSSDAWRWTMESDVKAQKIERFIFRSQTLRSWCESQDSGWKKSSDKGKEGTNFRLKENTYHLYFRCVCSARWCILGQDADKITWRLLYPQEVDIRSEWKCEKERNWFISRDRVKESKKKGENTRKED